MYSQYGYLEYQIRELRQKLNSMVSSKSLTDKAVIYYSQKLDKLIVEFELQNQQNTTLRKRAV